MEERKELFETYGIDLAKVVEEAKVNGNIELAELVEKQIANVQACYDAVAQRHTSCAGEALWKIDAEYLKTMMK